MDRVDITIIGAGVVGLAVAARLARKDRSVIIVEKNPQIGQETSSRNSEVIHSGIYYPQGTMKARFCVLGNRMLYSYLAEKGIRHTPLGKIVVASSEAEAAQLEELKANGERNGVEGLRLLTGAEVLAMEPAITVHAGLWVPSTGIMDTHSLMHRLLLDAQEKDAILACDSEVTAVERLSDGYRVRIRRDDYEFETGLLINCAGLNSDRVSALAGVPGFTLHYCKGQYFRVHTPLNVTRLVYPVPDLVNHSLGIHLTPDLAGGTRFGPDAHYIDNNTDYRIDESRREEFCRSINRYLPSVRVDDLCPDTAGIRPKLQDRDDGFRDFVIRREAGSGPQGFINLVGIESPGLTSSLAIADHVHTLL